MHAKIRESIITEQLALIGYKDASKIATPSNTWCPEDTKLHIHITYLVLLG